MKLTRRHLIKLSVVALASTALYKLRPLKSLFGRIESLKGNLNSDFEKNRFYHLSASLLGVASSSLDRNLSDRILHELAQNFHVRHQLKHLLDEYDHLLGKGRTFENAKELSVDVLPTAKKVLGVWYTGVIDFNEGKGKRLFYNESLMYDFYNQLRPAPGNCFGEFGYWSKRPEKVV